SRAAVSAAQHTYHAHALGFATRMIEKLHYTLEPQRMNAVLTPEGGEALEGWCAELGHVWRNRLHREETVATALAAIHLYQRDRHYLVTDGKVVIIDEATGRVAPGRIWSRGLHQLIEVKESCKPTGDQYTAAQITFQRFFPRYLRIGGMSGTLAEAGGELRGVYGLQITKVPLRQPCRRIVLPTRLFPNNDAH